MVKLDREALHLKAVEAFAEHLTPVQVRRARFLNDAPNKVRQAYRDRCRRYCHKVPGARAFHDWDRADHTITPAPDEATGLFDFVVAELKGDHSDEAVALLYTLILARAQREMVINEPA